MNQAVRVDARQSAVAPEQICTHRIKHRARQSTGFFEVVVERDNQRAVRGFNDVSAVAFSQMTMFEPLFRHCDAKFAVTPFNRGDGRPEQKQSGKK